MDELKVEAVLFASGKYLHPEYISEVTGLETDDVVDALKELQQRYDEDDTSIRIFTENNRWKMNVREQYSHIVDEVVSEAEMSGGAMKTLALVAYKSPVLQSEIVESRGSTSYTHLSDLEDRGFIDREREGRTYKLTVTEKFYDYFDLKGADDVSELVQEVEVEEPEVEVDEEEDEFDEEIRDRIQTLEKSEEEKEEEKEFLEDLDEKIDDVKENVEEVVDDEEFEED